MTNPANIYILYGSKIVLRKNILKKNKGDKTMKKVLLTSAVALAAFSAVQAVSAADNYVRKDPGIRTGVESTNNPNSAVPLTDGPVGVVPNRTVVSVKDHEVRVNDEGVRAVADDVAPFTFVGTTIGFERIYTYSDGTTSTTFISKDAYKPAEREYNPYWRGADKPVKYSTGTHVRVTVKDKAGVPVPGVKVAALVYATVEDFDNHKRPTPVEGVTDEKGDVEFPVKNGGYVVYRVDNAPKGYFVPNNLVEGTLLDAEEIVREGSDMFVTGVLTIEKTDTYNVARTEWVQGENGWHYYDNNKQVTGWKQIDGKWYFFNAEGVMQKWWVKDGNTWYYLNGSGAMETGWLQDGGKWYFLEASGAMKASQWFEVAGKWYYVDGSGALAVNTTVGGYTVNGNGEWVN